LPYGIQSLKDRTVNARTRPAKAVGWRLLVASLALIAFTFPSYVTQTHIHFAVPSSIGTIKRVGSTEQAGKVAGGQLGTQKKKTPSNDDPMKCPLCQAVGYAGHFVTPSAAALVLPLTPIAILPLAVSIVSPRESPSHIWQGRGPPSS
jgi:hypothetical protein